MQAIIDIVLPVFGLVLTGYLVARTRLLDDAAIKGIADFVYYVAVPALLFRTVAVRLDPAVLDLRVLAAYYGGSLLVFLVVAALGRLLFRIPAAECMVMGMGSIFSNTVMLGLPLVLEAFGEDGLLAFMLIVSTQFLVLFTFSTVAVELTRGGDGAPDRTGWRQAVRASLVSLRRNPIILAVLAGLAWRATG